MTTRNISNKNYSELMTLKTFEERYEYLKLDGVVGKETFGGHRYLNQVLYSSPEWKSFRNKVIIRDNGCDLACEDRPLNGRIYIHHIVPINEDDILIRSPCLFDLNNVICVSFETHQAIHYGSFDNISLGWTVRSSGDTRLW